MLLQCKLIKHNEVLLSANDVPYSFVDGVLTFVWDDMQHIIDFNNNEFTRENDDYSFFLDCINESCEINLKTENYFLPVGVEYATLQKDDSVVRLKYFIETDDEECELYIELEGE